MVMTSSWWGAPIRDCSEFSILSGRWGAGGTIVRVFEIHPGVIKESAPSVVSAGRDRKRMKIKRDAAGTSTSVYAAFPSPLATVLEIKNIMALMPVAQTRAP